MSNKSQQLHLRLKVKEAKDGARVFGLVELSAEIPNSNLKGWNVLHVGTCNEQCLRLLQKMAGIYLLDMSEEELRQRDNLQIVNEILGCKKEQSSEG